MDFVFSAWVFNPGARRRGSDSWFSHDQGWQATHTGVNPYSPGLPDHLNSPARQATVPAVVTWSPRERDGTTGRDETITTGPAALPRPALGIVLSLHQSRCRRGRPGHAGRGQARHRLGVSLQHDAHARVATHSRPRHLDPYSGDVLDRDHHPANSDCLERAACHIERRLDPQCDDAVLYADLRDGRLHDGALHGSEGHRTALSGSPASP